MTYQPDNGQIQKIKTWLGAGSINIFGIQFSGKDTQGARLADIFGAELIGGGDIIRKSDRQDVKKVVASGKLAPQQDYLDMMLPYFSKAEFDDKPLILSAVGRWHGEEQHIIDTTKESGHPLKAVILLELPEQEVWKRWELLKQQDDRGSRVDDSKKGLQTRLDEFYSKTLPVIEFYKKQGLLIAVNGNASRDQITQEIIEKLATKAN